MKQVVSRGHTRPLTEISFVQDGQSKTLLVSSAHDKTPQVRDGETGDWIGTFHGHKGAVWSAKIDARTRTLAATASGDFSAKLWCATTGKELHELKHKHVVKSVDFSKDTLKIATGCQDGLVRVYDTCQPAQPPTEYKVATGNDGITKIAWSLVENDRLIVGKKNGVIEKWDVRSNENSSAAITAKIEGTTDSIMDFEISEAFNLIMVACGKKVCAFNATDLSIVKEYEMPNPMTFRDEGGVSLCPDGTKFIAGGSDMWLREFSYNNGELLRTFKGHHGPIRCVRYHPSGNVGASGSEDGTIRLWDLNNNIGNQ